MSTQTDLLMFKDIISEMSSEDQEKINEYKKAFNALLLMYGDLGFIAFVVLGLELAIKEDIK